jgi:hypothetical protein
VPADNALVPDATVHVTCTPAIAPPREPRTLTTGPATSVPTSPVLFVVLAASRSAGVSLRGAEGPSPPHAAATAASATDPHANDVRLLKRLLKRLPEYITCK